MLRRVLEREHFFCQTQKQCGTGAGVNRSVELDRTWETEPRRSQESKGNSHNLYWQLLKILEIQELLIFMLEIIIIVPNVEANVRPVVLGLPLFYKFNFIFLEDHRHML